MDFTLAFQNYYDVCADSDFRSKSKMIYTSEKSQVKISSSSTLSMIQSVFGKMIQVTFITSKTHVQTVYGISTKLQNLRKNNIIIIQRTI